MSKNLIDLLNLPGSDPNAQESDEDKITELLDDDEIELATNEILGMVLADEKMKSIVSSIVDDELDGDLDALAEEAKSSYTELMQLGMNVEPKFSAPIFSVAATMLAHSITAKTNKAKKKLADARLRVQMSRDKGPEAPSSPPVSAVVYDRNELLKMAADKKTD